jgi:hypothetical protein
MIVKISWFQKHRQYLNKVTKNDALSNQSCNENNYHIAKTLKK